MLRERLMLGFFFFSSRRRHTRFSRDWSSDVCSSDLTDELFARVRSYFDDRQLVEITALLTLVNLDRFNAAFGIGSAGFSEGMVCVPPDRPANAAVIGTIG